MTVHHVVMFSSGIGSWAAARRLVDDGADPGQVTLLFADTNVEDADNYRFLTEAAADVIGELTMTTVDAGRKVWRGDTGGRLWWMTNHGRTIWDVFDEQQFLGNTRADPCSKKLKREPMRQWLEDRCDPDGTLVVLGFGFEEAHRLERSRPHWEPWEISAPMAHEPYMMKDAVLDWARDRGLDPPRLYDDAGGQLPHANCGGLCVKAGQTQFRAALFDDRLRPVYLEWERREQEFRDEHDADVAILRDRTGGTTDPLTLREYRRRLEDDPTLFDAADVGTCSCMTPAGQDT